MRSPPNGGRRVGPETGKALRAFNDGDLRGAWHLRGTSAGTSAARGGRVVKPTSVDEAFAGRVLDPTSVDEAFGGRVLDPTSVDEAFAGRVLDPTSVDEAFAGRVLDPTSVDVAFGTRWAAQAAGVGAEDLGNGWPHPNGDSAVGARPPIHTARSPWHRDWHRDCRPRPEVPGTATVDPELVAGKRELAATAPHAAVAVHRRIRYDCAWRATSGTAGLSGGREGRKKHDWTSR